ncbi:MAG: hypothetical protein JW829_06580 [Pirellulales bacterium]|nr:hypothetical protein [Pirellulales bacterium]
MTRNITTTDLEAFLDESLPVARMAAIEEALRRDKALGERLAHVIGRRDAGLHSLGAIWRRHRLSCPTREDLGRYLLDVLPPGAKDYITFHLETIGCRYCLANVEDLRALQEAADTEQVENRRRRYFQSSAGYLSGKK